MIHKYALPINKTAGSLRTYRTHKIRKRLMHYPLQLDKKKKANSRRTIGPPIILHITVNKSSTF